MGLLSKVSPVFREEGEKSGMGIGVHQCRLLYPVASVCRSAISMFGGGEDVDMAGKLSLAGFQFGPRVYLLLTFVVG